jgi:anti-sigma regulatory factor (Ser/Thr protein kinase)
MELYQGGMTKNLLDMSVEEALALQENLANAINHALKFGYKSFTMGTIHTFTEDGGKSIASKISFQVTNKNT